MNLGVDVLSTAVLIGNNEISEQLLKIEQKLVENPNWWETEQLANH